MDRIDQNLGCLVAHLKAPSQFEDIVLLLLYDNGAEDAIETMPIIGRSSLS